jgi:hypothetical protein
MSPWLCNRERGWGPGVLRSWSLGVLDSVGPKLGVEIIPKVSCPPVLYFSSQRHSLAQKNLILRAAPQLAFHLPGGYTASSPLDHRKSQRAKVRQNDIRTNDKTENQPLGYTFLSEKSSPLPLSRSAPLPNKDKAQPLVTRGFLSGSIWLPGSPMRPSNIYQTSYCGRNRDKDKQNTP